MTSVTEEQAEQERWTARLRQPGVRYHKLVENEFESPQSRDMRLAQRLRGMLNHAVAQVPYYGGLFRERKIDANADDPFAALAALPILTKNDVQEHRSSLRARLLPAGEEEIKWTQSSGTTGRPVAVLHSGSSTLMFTLLKQREYRWFRFDPGATFAAMRLPGHLPRNSKGEEPKSGETVTHGGWPYMEHFHTGPYIAISTDTPVEARLEWLRDRSPNYLQAYSQTLEVLAFASAGTRPSPSLKAVMAISEQLTPSMRALAERCFGTPVHQNYGLNEIGLVAARCEAGRYHVHAEHCLVEIVDENGAACAPGETGRIVVTGLMNFAMPLLRYDTGDLAVAAEADCACGRTLPGFADIAGRYSRAAFLPAGTLAEVQALRAAIEEMPANLTAPLREFQIHQFLDRRLELRLVTKAPLPDGFFSLLTLLRPDLVIRICDGLERAQGGKFQVFTSDFMPRPDP